MQSNKSSFIREQDQRASSANSLMFAQKRESQKVRVVKCGQERNQAFVLGKGES